MRLSLCNPRNKQRTFFFLSFSGAVCKFSAFCGDLYVSLTSASSLFVCLKTDLPAYLLLKHSPANRLGLQVFSTTISSTQTNLQQLEPPARKICCLLSCASLQPVFMQNRLINMRIGVGYHCIFVVRAIMRQETDLCPYRSCSALPRMRTASEDAAASSIVCVTDAKLFQGVALTFPRKLGK